MSLTEKKKLELEELANRSRQALTVYDLYPVPMRTVLNRIHDLNVSPRITTRVEQDDQMILDQAFTVSDEVKREIVLSATTEKEVGISSRANFTLAHEIGHALLHKSDRAMSRSKSHKDYRSNAGVSNLKWKEEEANYFAGAFLMPRDSIALGMTEAEIMHKFSVSRKTAEIRLLDIQKQRTPRQPRQLSESMLLSLEKMGIDTAKYRE